MRLFMIRFRKSHSPYPPSQLYCFILSSSHFRNLIVLRKSWWQSKLVGADPEKNRQLAQVIADAKVNNVPRDVIERQLSKANAATTIGKKHNVNLRILFSSSHTYFFAEFLHSPFNLNSNFMLTILSWTRFQILYIRVLRIWRYRISS